jgi:hypothetical protein
MIAAPIGTRDRKTTLLLKRRQKTGSRHEMKSKLWTQKYEDVKKYPYDYESQELFLKEALSVLDEVFKHYDKFQLKFHLDERSVEKAIWMLHLDALDTLRDCVVLLKQKKHRIVGKLFRDVTEVIDLATLFWWERDNGSENLIKWYDDKVIPHRTFRQHLKNTKGESFSKYSADIYEGLSRWTHHCYSILKNSYSLGGNTGEMLVYDSHSEILILPQTISQYIWEIKDLILYFLGNVKMAGLIDWKKISVFLNQTIHGLKFL